MGLKLEVGKKYENAAGRVFRVICVDRAGSNKRPVLALGEGAAGVEYVWEFAADGTGASGPDDLVKEHLPKIKVRIYLLRDRRTKRVCNVSYMEGHELYNCDDRRVLESWSKDWDILSSTVVEVPQN